MNTESENFESLQRLLALKRHELPPPGYFNNFSREVIGQIRAGSKTATATDGFSWLRRLWSALEAKPALAGTLGVAVCCGLLVVGVLYSEKMDEAVAATAPNGLAENNSWVPSMSGGSSALTFNNQTGNQTPFGFSNNGIMVAPPADSLFNRFQIQVAPAGLNFNGQ